MTQFHKPLTILLTGAGILHLLPPTGKIYDTLVPAELPGSQRSWTIASGAAELATAYLLSQPHTRRTGATTAAILFIAVFPGNIKMTYDWRLKPAWMQVISYGRLPLQLPLIWAAWKTRQES
ncbi:DoxX family protein [Corynebacterium kalidii]